MALDPAERRVVESNSVSGGSQAQSAAPPSDSELCTDLARRAISQVERAIPGAFSTRHEPTVATPPHPSLISLDESPLYHLRVRLIDSHCHLNAERFAGDEAAVLERARAAGVERILVPGWNVASSNRALELATRFEWLDASVGVHPHDAAKVDAYGWRAIVARAPDPRVVAIGETGLDYDRAFSPIPDQLANLRRNLELALETGKPAILHVRSKAGLSDAQDALVSELEAAGFGGARAAAAFGADRPPAVIHSFSGSVEYARRVLDLGLAISISGLAFRAGEEPTAGAVALVPADRLLVETDSPFLSPPGAPRGRNEPEWVRITASWVAEQRAIDDVTLGDQLVVAYDRTIRRPEAA
jgi:TatD DNase family protein